MVCKMHISTFVSEMVKGLKRSVPTLISKVPEI